MKIIGKLIKYLIIIVLILAAAGYGYYRFFLYEPPLITDEDRAQITLMPLPAKLELTGVDIPLDQGITPLYTDVKTPLSEKAVERFLQHTNIPSSASGLPLNITIGSDNDSIAYATDESYTLQVRPSGIYIESSHSLGIIRALETVRQLIKESAGIRLPAVEIEDHPRFPWRGLMVDVSRHFIPKDVILRIIESMAAVKLNVFHWHLSDDQGFRVESMTFPLLHEIGSNGLYYTQEEIREVIRFARERGIRVIPEFDLPGHSQSWQLAYPMLASTASVPGFGQGATFSAPMDPTREEVYGFLDEFVAEMSVLFPDEYFHIGGDEVNPNAWEESERIQDFMTARGMQDHHDLQAYFNERMQTILKAHGKKMLGWDEILTPELDTDVIVQSWTSHRALFEAVQQGGTAILSAGLYLDHILPAGEHYAVDPLVLEGAVDIEPDTGHWKMFDQVMMVGENTMESQLIIFDRNPEDVSGFFAMMSDRLPFKGGKIDDGVLTCTMDGPAGEMTYTANISGDSLEGSISLALLSFSSTGHRTGGSDMPGTEMPVIEVMRPLTEEEKDQIIGGEACQWAEFVDGGNIESRIWPRAAAIAEKLWSPPQLTQDTEDMYRRLTVTSDRLTAMGSAHDTQFKEHLSELIDEEGLPALTLLAEYLEEVKYHGRMPALLGSDSVYLPDFSLDRIVDAVRPESMAAREFNLAADRYLVEGNTDDKSFIVQILQKLEENDPELRPFLNSSARLREVDSISLELSRTAGIIRRSLENGDSPDSSVSSSISFLENGQYGVVVAIAPGLRLLAEQ